MTAPSRIPPFHQSDVTRAVRGMEKAGIEVGKVVIRPDGTIELFPYAPPQAAEIRRQLDDAGVIIL